MQAGGGAGCRTRAAKASSQRTMSRRSSGPFYLEAGAPTHFVDLAAVQGGDGGEQLQQELAYPAAGLQRGGPPLVQVGDGDAEVRGGGLGGEPVRLALVAQRATPGQGPKSAHGRQTQVSPSPASGVSRVEAVAGDGSGIGGSS